jgi:hypothetical protein
MGKRQENETEFPFSHSYFGSYFWFFLVLTENS